MNMPTAKTVVSTAASVAASAMVVRSIARDLVPIQLRYLILRSITWIFKSIFGQITLIIEELEGLASNQIYRAAEIYLGTKVSPSTQIYRVSLPEKEAKITVSMAKNQEVVDIFEGVQFRWRKVTKQVEAKQLGWLGQASLIQSEIRHFELSFHKKYKEMVLDSYIPFILRVSNKIKEEKKTPKLHTLDSDHVRRSRADAWHSIKLDHPATFETLAMDLELKQTIVKDIERFVRRKDYYRRVGKAWKRGYLLYGPPGTGKSSLVAAMANYLNFDIYDLELTDIHTNSELRRVLLATANRSILVIEDIDCGIELQARQHVVEAEAHPPNPLRPTRTSKVTLSGLLNFIDGLWSSCGDERIIVFTTNHKDRLDPALLRPGRMDVHIHMSYCTPCGFTTLAANYLGLTHHSLFIEITQLLGKTHVTPAEIGEQLLKSEDPDTALRGLIDFLHGKSELRTIEYI